MIAETLKRGDVICANLSRYDGILLLGRIDDADCDTIIMMLHKSPRVRKAELDMFGL